MRPVCSTPRVPRLSLLPLRDGKRARHEVFTPLAGPASSHPLVELRGVAASFAENIPALVIVTAAIVLAVAYRRGGAFGATQGQLRVAMWIVIALVALLVVGRFVAPG